MRIIHILTKSDPHRENLNDDYNTISQRALDEKKQAALQKWFTTKIPTIYIMIDKDFKHCSNLSKWMQNAAVVSN